MQCVQLYQHQTFDLWVAFIQLSLFAILFHPVDKMRVSFAVHTQI